VELMARGDLPSHGFVCQEQVDLDALMATPTGKMLGDATPVAA
jgi:hypothetical protein